MKLIIMMFLVLLTGCFFSYPSTEIQEQLATNAAIDLITKHLEDEYANIYTYLGPIKVNSIKLSDVDIKITKEKSVKILIDNEETKAWPIIADLDIVAFADYTENKL
ncbi:MAG: hypothetical protein A2X79_02185 [Desulfuromonadaceae bacterium GWB2_53_15]|nr:MAG: hypothetical protein A2X79_02185 [Desulfuromonadaceae bacterium GWB2_53_15]